MSNCDYAHRAIGHGDLPHVDQTVDFNELGPKTSLDKCPRLRSE